MARDPLFNPKMMGLRSAEVKELRSSNPALATMSTTASARSHDLMNHHLHKSSTNISSLSQQQSLREHNKHFSASAVALHSNHMFTSSRGNNIDLIKVVAITDDISFSFFVHSNVAFISLSAGQIKEYEESLSPQQ